MAFISEFPDGWLLPCKCFFFFNVYLFDCFGSQGFPGGSVVKILLANARDAGLIPGSGRSLGGGLSNPLQYSCLENPMD